MTQKDTEEERTFSENPISEELTFARSPVHASEMALRESDEAILSLALTAKKFARNLRQRLSQAPKDGLVEVSDLDNVKILMGITDSVLKLGKRAEEITARHRQGIKQLSTIEIEKRLAEQPRKNVLPDRIPLGDKHYIVFEDSRESAIATRRIEKDNDHEN